MEIEEIKKLMIEYRDFYGGDLLHIDEIKNASSKKELCEIIEKHHDFLTDSLSDAKSHLENFKRNIGLNLI